MALKNLVQLARAGIPELDSYINGTGCEQFAIRGEIN
ncbi:hypothetical protein EYZ11_003161 [Aspergillus tanneri]|uniref:Uncharacterized protein n=1 Tax=Aspergillus tanneri TaxID=1220188 RepID=A0A4S3JR64_9EURO|nr:hypothetical protein EYZ11_003161 [Aspergillus tanneri]